MSAAGAGGRGGRKGTGGRPGGGRSAGGRSGGGRSDAGRAPGAGRGAGRSGASRGGSSSAGSSRGASARGGGGGRGSTVGRGRTGVGRTEERGREPDRRRGPGRGLGGDQVEGRQAVRELLRAGRRPVRSVMMADGMDSAEVLDEIEQLAASRRVRVDVVSRRRLDLVAKTESSQGVLALTRPLEETPLEDLTGPGPEGRPPFLLVVDGITDPQNLGSLLRSAECAGVTGVVLPRHRAVHLSPTVTKVAAGAIEYLPMTVVAGIPAALGTLRGLGVWTVGLAGESRTSLYDLDLGDQPVALVLGAEGVGLAPLTRRRCDVVAAIPQHGSLSSLNVSTAGAIACFDIARQRAGTPPTGGDGG